jgi:4-hydroxybenzoate polyprenyltransferase
MTSLSKFYRLSDWIKNLGVCIIGFLAAQLASNDFSPMTFLAVFSVLLYLALGYAVSFSVNDFYDSQYQDEDNYGKKVIEKIGRGNTFMLTAVPFMLMALILQIAENRAFMLIFVSTVVFILYSIPPFRLKRYFFLSIPINAVFIGVTAILAGYFIANDKISQDLVMLSIIFTVYPALTEVIAQLADIESDRRGNILSLPVAFGARKTIQYAAYSQLFLGFTIAAIVGLGYNNPMYLGSVVFATVRFIRMHSLKETADFDVIRGRMLGSYEGVYYIAAIIVRIVSGANV